MLMPSLQEKIEHDPDSSRANRLLNVIQRDGLYLLPMKTVLATMPTSLVSNTGNASSQI